MVTSKKVRSGARLRLTFHSPIKSEPPTVLVGVAEEDARDGAFPFSGVDATTGAKFGGVVALHGLARVERA